MAARSFLGAGKVLADVFVNGEPSGKLIEFQQIGKFALAARSELKEQTSKGKEDYGQILETVAIPQPAEFSMTLREINRDALRLALMADMSTLNASSATIADEAVVARLGSYVALTRENISSTGFNVTHTSGSPAYVLGTDYDVNWRFGKLRALAGGAITEAQSLKVDFTAMAVSGVRLSGNRRPSLRCRLYFDGINLVDELPCLVTVWEVLLTPSGEVDLMSDDWVTVDLQGRMKTPVGKSEPFIIDMLDTVV